MRSRRFDPQLINLRSPPNVVPPECLHEMELNNCISDDNIEEYISQTLSLDSVIDIHALWLPVSAPLSVFVCLCPFFGVFLESLAKV
jgi:hypothetical protein